MNIQLTVIAENIFNETQYNLYHSEAYTNIKHHP